MYRVAIVDDQAEDAEALAQALERCRPATAGPGPVWEISRFPTASALAACLGHRLPEHLERLHEETGEWKELKKLYQSENRIWLIG